MKQHKRTLYDVIANTPTGPVRVSVYAVNPDKAHTRADRLLGTMVATYTIDTITPRPTQTR